IERGSVGDLPAEERDALPAVGVDHKPLLAVVHAEGKRGAALVDALEAEKIRAVAGPIRQILGANADIAQSGDAHDDSSLPVLRKISRTECIRQRLAPRSARPRESGDLGLHASLLASGCPLSRA